MVVPERLPRVLVVDDEPIFRRMLVHLLGMNGFDCTEAADGKTALALMNSQSFDLGVFDIVMPGMSGCELASITLTIAPTMRLIAVTACACSVELMDFGFEVAMQKPFDNHKFLRSCRRLSGAPGGVGGRPCN